MSKQQIPTVCIQCQKHFLSKKRNTKFCSDICKAKEKRDRDKLLLKTVLSKMANCEDCGKREKIERLTHIGLKKDSSLLCYDCWNKRHSG